MLMDPPPEPAGPPGTTHKWQGKIIGDWAWFLSKKFASSCVWSPPWLLLTRCANRAGMMPLCQVLKLSQRREGRILIDPASLFLLPLPERHEWGEGWGGARSIELSRSVEIPL